MTIDDPFPNPFRQDTSSQSGTQPNSSTQAGRSINQLEQFIGTQLQTHDLIRQPTIETASLKAAVVGFYFSAHWCPPCRRFTPQLATWYNGAKAQYGQDFEIIFASLDRTSGDFNEYFSTMPWLAIPFGGRLGAALCQRMEVQGVPTLIFLKSSGEIIDRNGVMLVQSGMINQVLARQLQAVPKATSAQNIPPDQNYLPNEPGSEHWAVDSIIEQLQSAPDVSAEQRMQGFKVVFNVCQNILNHPNDARYRTLKKDNKNVKTKLEINKGFIRLLKVVGFRESATSYVLPMDVPLVKTVLEELRDMMQCLTVSATEEETSQESPAKGIVCDGNVCRKID